MAKLIFSPTGTPPVKKSTHLMLGKKFNDRAIHLRLGDAAKRDPFRAYQIALNVMLAWSILSLILIFWMLLR